MLGVVNKNIQWYQLEMQEMKCSLRKAVLEKIKIYVFDTLPKSGARFDGK